MGRRGDRSGIAIAVLLGCSLVPPINSACLNVALDDLATDLGATTADLQWVLNAYTLGYIGTLLAAARLGDAVGQVRALGTGHVVFLGATLVAAVAPSPPLLVACRFVMGVAGAVMQTMSLSLFSGLNVDPRRRARAFSWWAATASLGLTLGPILGGILLQLFWWGSIFLLNVPLLVVLTLCVVRWVPEVAPRVRGDWDVGGILLSVAGLTAVIWAVIEAPARGWTHPTTLAALAVGVAVLAAFVAWESRPEHTLLDLSYFRNAQMSASVVSFIGITFTYGGGLLLTSLTLRSTLGLSPLATGFSLTPLALAMVVAAVASAPVGRRMGLRWTITAGLALVLASSLTVALLGPEGPLPLVLALALLGAGFGLANAPAIEAG
ncbi:MAG: MFS transporter, partial [Acidimicrobiia bacterium]